MAELCAATNCGREIPPTVLFCQRHWWMVPPDLKRKLLKPKNTAARETALKQAVGVIEFKEGK